MIHYLSTRASLSLVDCSRTVSLPASLLEDRRDFYGMREVDMYRKQLRRLDETTVIIRRR